MLKPGLVEINSWLWITIAMVFGLAIGSFSSVLISRVPNGISIRGRSQCPRCLNNIGWRENIPLLSYFYQRGKCRRCAEKISRIYPAIELSMALLFGLPFALFHNGGEILFWLVFVSFGIPLSVIDVLHHRLPDFLTGTLFIAEFFALAIWSLSTKDYSRIKPALLSAIFLLMFYLAIALISRGGMGLGDVKLSASIGLVSGFFGLNSVIVSSFAAFFLGAAVGIVLMIFGKAGRKTSIPFGPFMIIGQLVGIAANSWRLF